MFASNLSVPNGAARAASPSTLMAPGAGLTATPVHPATTMRHRETSSIDDSPDGRRDADLARRIDRQCSLDDTSPRQDPRPSSAERRQKSISCVADMDCEVVEHVETRHRRKSYDDDDDWSQWADIEEVPASPYGTQHYVYETKPG